MNDDCFVVDTMAIVLRLERRKLPLTIKEIFVAAENGDVVLKIPVICLAEIGYLNEKGRIELNIETVLQYSKNSSSIEIASLTGSIIQNTFKIDDIPELHDRIIAGTALEENRKLITNDNQIARSRFVTTIW